MNAELEMTKHKEFYRLKEDFKAQLWNILGDVEYTMFYDRVVDVLVDGMNDSFKVGEGK